MVFRRLSIAQLTKGAVGSHPFSIESLSFKKMSHGGTMIQTTSHRVKGICQAEPPHPMAEVMAELVAGRIS